MMKKIVVELEGTWVLKHREDEELPIAKLGSLLKGGEVSIESTSLTSMTVLVKGGDQEVDQIVNKIKTTFLNCYPDEKIEEILNLEISVVEEKATEETSSPAEERDEEFCDLIKEILGSKPEEEKAKDSASQISEVMERVSGLVGAMEFKDLICEIVKVAPQIIGDKTQPVFNGRSYLFSIGDGCGLTTYLDLLAKAISAAGLCTMHPSPAREEKLDVYKESMEPFNDVMRVLGNGDSDKVRILCIDISEWLGKTNNRYFKKMLRKIEKVTDEFIVVFKVPFLDKDVLADLNFSLNDLLSVRTVSFPPFTQEDLKVCAERELKGYGFTVSKNAWEFFSERITVEKSDGRFYGLNTVKKVVRELIYNKQLANAGKKKASHTIGRSDMKALCSSVANPLSGMEQLSRLVGNEQVKKKVGEMIAQIELSIRENAAERPCIHMRFVGNPGTGKTTVARIIGKILKEKGLLRIGDFYEYAGRDFCGRYIGETAPKTASICRDAYGSVLFIDEAYSLYRGDDNDRDFGREALDTLIAEMENHRSDFVVIMAGYTDDMEKLMRGNRGLASRMPYTIEFPNFTREQLYEIYVSMVKERFKYDDKLFDAAHEYFMSLSDEVINAKEFSNARFVRNLFERTWAKAAMRSQLLSKGEITLTKDDFDRASSEKEFAFNIQKKTRIGF